MNRAVRPMAEAPTSVAKGTCSMKTPAAIEKT
jgi:HAMP domain-containing protein